MKTNLIPGSFIIKEPFTGTAQTWIKENGQIAYAEHCKSLHEFEELRGEKFKIVTSDEFTKMHDDFYFKPFREISYEEYDEMLNCLPPLKWHNINSQINVFFCSELYSGNISSCYLYDSLNKKYYSGRLSVYSTDDEILKNFNKI